MKIDNIKWRNINIELRRLSSSCSSTAATSIGYTWQMLFEIWGKYKKWNKDEEIN